MQDKDDQGHDSDSKPELSGKGVRGQEARRQAEARRERAARTLRENLLRRKQQGRARRAGDADETSGLPAAKSDESGD
ncbi:hypothetical protein JNB71_09885 [Rhizobium herbae]|uniref:DUF4169 family protein n=1 Tax=Rhizobium herbae TaxID=508661 RepID=A0ABS7HBH6_9HYPH|nr:hypothetical protein [Rhizobium herbae]MBW9063628.1 hypothetical protein [Rhizobium herbae]